MTTTKTKSVLGCILDTNAFNHSINAANYLDALYPKDTKVILEIRGDRLLAVGCGKYMALGLDVGIVSAPNQRLAEITARDWARLSKLINCFESATNSTGLGISITESAITFLSETQGWALTIPANPGGDLLRFPTANLKAVVDLGAMATVLGHAIPKLGDDAEKRHRLEFGFSTQQTPIVKVVSRDGVELSKIEAESIYLPASGLSINPAHLHDGIVLLKKQHPMKAKAKLSSEPDMNYWIVQCADRQDYLLVSRFR